MNNLISISNSTLSMTSREIAELTGKSHSHVLRDIRSILNTLNISEIKFKYTYIDSTGKSNVYFNLPKQLVLTLISSYDIKARYLIFSKIEAINLSELLNMFDAEELSSNQFVYVAKEDVSGRYKVGISKDPERRVKQLNIGNPEKLILMGVYQANLKGKLSEIKAHDALSKWKLRSEWFSSNADINLISTVV